MGAPPPPVSAIAIPGSAAPVEPNRRILLVDDSPSIHADFRKILCARPREPGLAEAELALFGTTAAEAPSYELDSAYQGTEALAQVRRALAAHRPYAVAFVDMRMPPGLDGAQTAEALWALDARLQVVICTAYSDLPWDDVIQRLGTSDRLLILKKPFDMIEVAQLARALTAKWTLVQQAQSHAQALEETVRELRGSQEALLRTAEALEAFTHAVSHDLQSPLARIASFGALLAEELQAGAGSGKAVHYLHRMRANAAVGQDLVKGLLMLTDVARSPFTPEALDLASIAYELVAELREASPDRRVTVTIAPRLPAWGDPVLLRIALANVLGNAWKFSTRAPHARIEVGLAEDGDAQGVFFVRDNGCGFDMGFADRLFHNFQRLHDPSDYPGTGVGLATVSRIVARHGGRVWADAAPGAGCTVYLSLPRSPAAPRHAE